MRNKNKLYARLDSYLVVNPLQERKNRRDQNNQSFHKFVGEFYKTTMLPKEGKKRNDFVYPEYLKNTKSVLIELQYF